MSDTPRTDAEGCYPDDACSEVVDADFARTLERELTAAKAGRTQGGPAMSDLYKAAQQALEVLESYRGQVNIHGESPAADMCAIVRAALAQQAEPVREWQGLTDDEFWLLTGVLAGAWRLDRAPPARLLAEAAQQIERAGLSEEHYKLTRLARAIEAALKEKNK